MREFARELTEATTEQEAIERLRVIVERKLEAAQRLADHPDASPAQRLEGKRGELQALSHLASLNDARAAETLEKLARSYLAESESGPLELDSRLVLLGFAVEALQHGKEGAADRILQQVDALAAQVSAEQMPAIIGMAQAREALQRAGRTEAARRVRRVIIDTFADSPDPRIAEMAARLAGSVPYDEIDRLRAAAVSGEDVKPQQWREAVATLIDTSADIATVSYLAAAALELHASGNPELADITYGMLEERFDDPSTAIGREARLALEARDARREVMGEVIEFDLPSVLGEPLSLETYRGQIVLMPFWDSRFPESLQLLPTLRQLREKHPEEIAVIGVNLDPEGADVRSFVRERGIDFPNFRAATSSDGPVRNEVANRFGIVSMPFTVVLDREGRVTSIDLNGESLEATVSRLGVGGN